MPDSTIIKQLPPAGKFFFLLALFIASLIVASVVQLLVLLPYADLKSINDIAKLEDLSSPNIIKGMKIAQAASVLIMFILPSFLFALLSSEKKISYLNINKGFTILSGICALLLVFTAMPLINWMGELNSHLALPGFMSGIENWMKASEESAKKLTEVFLQMSGFGDLTVNLIVVALLAALGEELFFRGCMQNIFVEWTKNKHAAVWISAILFSALHAQFYGFLPRMLLGVALGYLYVWSGSLWLSILFHFLNNGTAVLFSFLVSKEVISENAETVGAGESPLYLVLISTVASLGLMYVVYKQQASPQPPPSEGV